MVSLNYIDNKLNKIKKYVCSNAFNKIYAFINENEPIKVHLISNNKIECIFCDNINDYVILKEKYKNIEITEFIGIKKPEAI